MNDELSSGESYRLYLQALKKGELHPAEVCEQCGAKPTQQNLNGHHDDYSKPFEVRWLCASCHAKLHPKRKPDSQKHSVKIVTQFTPAEAAYAKHAAK
jgi:hypothetical protein